MQVRVKLFAAARQAVGADAVDVEVGERPSVASLRSAIERQYPQLSGLLRHAVFAVNADYVSADAEIPPAAEVACIPPVSGG